MWCTEREMQPLLQGIGNNDVSVSWQDIHTSEVPALSAKGFLSILVPLEQNCSWSYSFNPLKNYGITFWVPALTLAKFTVLLNENHNHCRWFSDVSFSKWTNPKYAEENVVLIKDCAAVLLQHKQPVKWVALLFRLRMLGARFYCQILVIQRKVHVMTDLELLRHFIESIQ